MHKRDYRKQDRRKNEMVQRSFGSFTYSLKCGFMYVNVHYVHSILLIDNIGVMI